MTSTQTKNIVFICLISFFFISKSLSQTSVSENTNKEKDWSVYVAPYALLASQATDVGGQKIRGSFNDLASMTNAGFQLIAIVSYKKYSLTFDGTYAELGTDFNQGPFIADLKVKQKIIGFKGAYVVYDNFEFDDDNVIKGWSLKVNLGAKYWLNNIGLDYQLLIGNTVIDEDTVSEKQEWWDLMVGINPKFVISKKFYLAVDFNIGGFGIGNSSDLDLDLTYLNSFKVSRTLAVHAGFRTFRYKQTEGSGDDRLVTKVSVLGPMLGVSFKLY
jgi:hypothetical protein